MGAEAIHYKASKTKYETARQAFNALVEEAQYEYGHDPYSGTIATCEFYGEIQKPVSDDAYELALDKIGKREVCFYEDDDHFHFIGWAAC